jgi:hypothetical protein
MTLTRIKRMFWAFVLIEKLQSFWLLQIGSRYTALTSRGFSQIAVSLRHNDHKQIPPNHSADIRIVSRTDQPTASTR